MTKKYLRECKDKVKSQVRTVFEADDLRKRINKLIKYIEQVQTDPFSLLITEDQLPKDMREVDYTQWIANSRIVDGVRMGLPLNK